MAELRYMTYAVETSCSTPQMRAVRYRRADVLENRCTFCKPAERNFVSELCSALAAELAAAVCLTKVLQA